jgi:hypothetical protein
MGKGNDKYASGMKPDEIKAMSRSIIGKELPEPDSDGDGAATAAIRPDPDYGDPNVATPSYCPHCGGGIGHLYPKGGAAPGVGGGTDGTT